MNSVEHVTVGSWRYPGDQSDRYADREYWTDLRDRAATYGRDPDELLFFPRIVPIVGATEEIAEAKEESYREDVEGVLALLSGFVDMDFSELDPDQLIEHIETEAIQGTVNAFAGGESEWTVREMAEFAGLGTTSPVVTGTPEQVADEFEYWFREVGVDGFNVKEVHRPGTSWTWWCRSYASAGCCGSATMGTRFGRTCWGGIG